MLKSKKRSNCICEFCKEEFTPRPQVKRPRACGRKSCQLKRQLANEKEWRSKNKGLYNKKYHNIMKQQRINKLQEYANKLFKIIKIGQNYLNEALKIDDFKSCIFIFFVNLGIRKVKKLWNCDNNKLVSVLR